MTIRALASGLVAFAALGGLGAHADEPRPFDQNPAFANEKLPRVYAGVAGGAVCANTGPAVSTAASAAPITVIFETFIKLSLSCGSYQLPVPSFQQGLTSSHGLPLEAGSRELI